MAQIVISEFMNAEAVQNLQKDFDVLYDPELVEQSEHLISQLKDAKALIVRNRTQVTAALLEQASQLVVVGRLGVGLDNIDVQACEKRSIQVCPAVGANTVAVAEYVMGAALVLMRGVYRANATMIAGDWPRQQLIGRELSGKVMGLVGFGAIAQEVAKRARAFDMSIAAFDPFVPEDDPAWDGVQRIGDLEELLKLADVVSLHVPLTEQTQNLLNEPRLKIMSPHAFLINTARGGIVDEAALAQQLKAGLLGGAALDVFAEEPLGAKAAHIYKELFEEFGNVILTPHIGGLTDEANVRVGDLVARQVRQALSNTL